MQTASKPSGSSSRTRSGARPSERKGRRSLARPSALSFRWREARLAAVWSVAYGALMSAVLPGTWPLMPFPQTRPMVLATVLSFPFGLLLRRRWAALLPLTLLVALDPPQSGFAGSVVALVIIGPFAAASICLGVGCARWLQRRALRRMLSRAAPPRRTAQAAR